MNGHSQNIPLAILIAHAQEDDNMRRELEKQLASLKRGNRIRCWSMSQVSPGSNRADAFESEFQCARIVLLLLSSDFLECKFWLERLDAILDRARNKEFRLVPVLLRHVDCEGLSLDAFGWLPAAGKPVAAFDDPDEAYLSIARHVRGIVDSMLTMGRLVEEVDQGLNSKDFESAVALDRLLKGRVPQHGDTSASSIDSDVPGVWSRLLQLPVRYRFLSVRSDHDLLEFVRLSEGAPDIAGTHPDLLTAGRMDLYRAWYLINPRSFLLLQRQASGQSPVNIACSIILPLTDSGQDRLRGGTVSVLNLRDDEIATSIRPSGHLLIDTWIIDRRYQSKHDHYGYALLLKHISLFWNPERQERIMLLVEPDNPSLYSLLVRGGFIGARKTASNSDLYELIYPDGLLQMHRAEYDRILANLIDCKTWDII